MNYSALQRLKHLKTFWRFALLRIIHLVNFIASFQDLWRKQEILLIPEREESIWGAPFGNEIKSHLKHNARGALGMANKGRDGTNGSQFYITFGKQTHLDGKNTVFGKLIDGFETLDAIERIKVDEKGKPEVDVVILDVTIHANPLAT